MDPPAIPPRSHFGVTIESNLQPAPSGPLLQWQTVPGEGQGRDAAEVEQGPGEGTQRAVGEGLVEGQVDGAAVQVLQPVRPRHRRHQLVKCLAAGPRWEGVKGGRLGGGRYCEISTEKHNHTVFNSKRITVG